MSKNSQNQKPEEIKSILPPNPWRVFIFEAFLFCLTLGLGIAAAFKINEILKTERIILSSISFWQFLLYFFLATIFVLFISRFKKVKKGKTVIFKGVFILATIYGGLLVINLWLPDILAIILVGILFIWWLKRPSILNHNLEVVLGIAGIGAILGLRFSPWLVVLFLTILSIYDFIAVYKTKHMIKMAKEMLAAGTILGLIVPPKISDFRENLREVQAGGRFLILGGGDVAFPLLLCASLVPEGMINSLVVAIFALIGLSASFYIFISQKIRRPIPALPPIALFSIIGFLITRLI